MGSKSQNVAVVIGSLMVVLVFVVMNVVMNVAVVVCSVLMGSPVALFDCFACFEHVAYSTLHLLGLL